MRKEQLDVNDDFWFDFWCIVVPVFLEECVSQRMSRQQWVGIAFFTATQAGAWCSGETFSCVYTLHQPMLSTVPVASSYSYNTGGSPYASYPCGCGSYRYADRTVCQYGVGPWPRLWCSPFRSGLLPVNASRAVPHLVSAAHSSRLGAFRWRGSLLKQTRGM